MILTDVTAARYWELPLPPWIGLDEAARESWAVSPRQARSRSPRVRGRRLRIATADVVVRDGLRITTPARTWVDCAEFVPFDHLVAMGDAILRRGLASQQDLRSCVHNAFGRRGVAVARRALPLLDPRSESPGESLTRAAFATYGVRAPECNVNIFDRGAWLARVDMCWRRERVIVEYDGEYHFTPEQQKLDSARRRRLAEAGWVVLVVTAADLAEPIAMCNRVLAALHGAVGS